ncbi:Dihydrouridine synthase TIM-barrel protein yjbN [Rhodospirillum rubrum ATCC 11170]|uniref:tRNA-dihydrouridine(20/20a) synthase n=2 Tax=Rhodospirillum rubrum TaxID=1085 RepID=Q2RTX4_RHORT|nr:Dihydrouridine synthase TIM-barrel protein yjbN [Rhodospirillum rubrum ATCC 11170]MBK5954002.1 tRNA dihydrouridine(20/20a) synthase DusA [Rhodospirillum rubrum]
MMVSAPAPRSQPDRSQPDRRLSVAPMMDWTDRHDRWFLRQITKRTLLYTEMITAQALLHADPGRFLDHHPDEHPLALQLGGSDPRALAEATRLAAPFGFAEINLNVGCPSDRVSSGRFGACLMADPALVAECLSAMAEASNAPVTIKHRIGIDDLDSYDQLVGFVDQVARSGIATIIVHARKAWLKGLSPKENREIPPLRHDVVHRLKADFPGLEVILNGGITTLTQALDHLGSGDPAAPAVDGVMIGRAAYETPYMLAQADGLIFGEATPAPSRHEVALALLPYLDAMTARGEPVKRLTRHILGLFHGQPGARAYRRHLGEAGVRPDATAQVLIDALAHIPALDEAES